MKKGEKIMTVKTLEDFLRERDEFLKENPHMQPYQDEIDAILEKVPGGIKNRLAVLAVLIEAKLIDLSKQFKVLNKKMQKFCKTAVTKLPKQKEG